MMMNLDISKYIQAQPLNRPISFELQEIFMGMNGLVM
jgi:hypothetical protein